MAVNRDPLQKALKEGIEAIESGNRVRGRDRLLAVVQRDRNSELAWWWLYQVGDDADEQMLALEHVLRLNPEHPEAQAALVGLRQEQIARWLAPAANWAEKLAESPPEADDGLDDPYQCPYCGRPAGIDRRRCPHCRGGLYARVARPGEAGSLRLVLLLIGISLGLGVMEMMGPALGLGAALRSADPRNLKLLQELPGVEAFLGNFLTLGAQVSWLLIKIYAVRAGLLLVVLLSLRERLSLGYYAALLATLADMLLSLYLLITGYGGWAGTLLNLVMSLAIGILLFGLNSEFAVNIERIMVKADPSARSPLDFYKRGHQYCQRGMWAMAVAQWRKAVGLAPRVTEYYKHLGIGYAQIKRYDRSLRALEEAGRQAPDDGQIAEIIALVRGQSEAQALLKRR
jgi:tetratricopeptide (TPR) repeat protein